MTLLFDHDHVCRVAAWAVRVLRRLHVGPCVSSSFTAWAAAVHRRRLAHRMSAIAVLHRCSRLCQCAMAVWVASSARRRLKRTALAHWRRQTVAAWFNTWRRSAHDARCEHLQVKQATLHWAASRLRYVENANPIVINSITSITCPPLSRARWPCYRV